MTHLDIGAPADALLVYSFTFCYFTCLRALKSLLSLILGALWFTFCKFKVTSALYTEVYLF